MPSISIQYNPKVGPLLQIAILPPHFRLPNNTEIKTPAEMKFYMALVDTGASCTCISAKVIQDLELLPLSKQQVFGVHGSGVTNSYQFQVGLAFPQSQHPSGVLTASMIALPVAGIEFVPAGAGFDVLLGRDIVCAGSFSLSFDGHAILSV